MDIKSYRRSKGLSQVQFAALLSAVGVPVTQSLVSQWESGAVAITPDRASQIEVATRGEISRIELVFGEGAHAKHVGSAEPPAPTKPTKAEAA